MSAIDNLREALLAVHADDTAHTRAQLEGLAFAAQVVVDPKPATKAELVVGLAKEMGLELPAPAPAPGDAQRSAEDWRDVALTLSTAEPTRFTSLPELPSFRIGRRQRPPARRGWREPPAGADALFADYDAGYDKIRGASNPKSVKKTKKKRPDPSPKRSRMDADLDGGPMAMAAEVEESFAGAPPPPPPAMPAPQSMPFGPPASLGAAGGAPPPPARRASPGWRC